MYGQYHNVRDRNDKLPTIRVDICRRAAARGDLNAGDLNDSRNERQRRQRDGDEPKLGDAMVRKPPTGGDIARHTTCKLLHFL